ncbi:MAG TPA: MFS transporter, partial [Planctomycetaceae bacterium]|nr:MFS transporter [Planctomycetaceae bacterium]
MRHWLLPALLPTLLTPGLMGTVLFFNQTHLAELKGWKLVAMAPAFSCFALSGVMASFWAGWAVDRFGGHRLIPFLLLPIGFGMALVSQATSIT